MIDDPWKLKFVNIKALREAIDAEQELELLRVIPGALSWHTPVPSPYSKYCLIGHMLFEVLMASNKLICITGGEQPERKLRTKIREIINTAINEIGAICYEYLKSKKVEMRQHGIK